MTHVSQSSMPIFGSGERCWSLGSIVVATWWEDKTSLDQDGQPVQVTQERSETGIVAGIVGDLGFNDDGDGIIDYDSWTILVTFGPLLDLISQTKFRPSQLSLAHPDALG